MKVEVYLLAAPLARSAGVEGLEDDIDNALRSEHVPTAHGCRRRRVQEGVIWDLDYSYASSKHTKH